MKPRILTVLAAGVLAGSLGAKTASAQWVVVDPTNLVENLISALENTEAVLNQITQLSHEVQSLAYQAQNLTQMPSSVSASTLTRYTTTFAQLAGAMQNINGIAANVANLTNKYNATFPNTPLAQGPLSSANVMSQLTGWLNQSRSVYQGAYNTQAQVMQSLGADSASVQQLLQTSGSSQGALSAIQSGNQLVGQVAAQLMKINSQMATTNQAQMNWIAEQSQLMAQAQKNATDAMSGYTAPSTAVVNLSYNRFQ
jgi:P-type conjugative transfer protein TrbJ